MTDAYFVIFNKNGIDRFLKTDRFDLKSGEYAVRMEIATSPEKPGRRATPAPWREWIEWTIQAMENSNSSNGG